MADSGTNPVEPADSRPDSHPSDPLANPTAHVLQPAPSSPHSAPSNTSPEEPVIASPVPVDQQATVISSPHHLDQPSPAGVTSPLALDRDMEGCTLGPFHLEKFVGGGGMGSVYRATDLALDRTVAVKVLCRKRSSDEDEDIVRRFENEAQSAARLDHENIARVYYVGEDKGFRYIVFEYIEGTNIRDLVVEAGPLALEDAISYVLQIAEALAHAARRDVVHRDIKPSNVLITPDGRAKLVDMGLARLDPTRSSQEDLTATGVTLGTFDYISPEQARDPRIADVRSDLYSLGCTFYFMLTCRPPFPEGTVLQKLLSHSSDEPTDPQVLRPDLPDEIANILRRLLVKNPDQRYQEPSELVGELLVAADRLGLRPTSQCGTVWISSDAPPLSRLERHLPWAAPLLLLILAVIGMDTSWPPPLERANETDTRFLSPLAMERAAPGPADTEPAGPSRDSISVVNQSDRESNLNQPPLPSAATDTNRGDVRFGSGAGRIPPAESPRSPNTLPTSPTDGMELIPGGRNSVLVSSNEKTPSAQNEQNSGPQTIARSSATSPKIPSDAAASQAPFLTSRLPDVEDANAVSGADGDVVPTTAPRPDLLIVGDYDESSPWDESLFCDSLEAACRKSLTMSDIKTIELRYNGSRSEPDQPITLDNPDLTIRAADGFSPVVRFQPEPGPPAMSPLSMIRVIGGRLRIEGVQLELDVPVDPEDRWQLFQLQQVAEFELDRCLVTIRDPTVRRWSYEVSQYAPHRERAAVIDLQVPPGSDSVMDQEDDVMDGWSVLVLRHCVVRGEATMVRAAEAVPFRLNWKNGLLAITERMLTIGGAQKDPNEKGEHIRLELEHITAHVERGLCRIDSDDDMFPYMMTVDINCSQCIFMTTSTTPLVEQIGVVDHELDELDVRLLFSGERNFYENVEVYLRVEARSRLFEEIGEVEYFSRQLDAEDWQERWKETLAKANKVEWRRLPGANVPMHAHGPKDYYLKNRLGNLAVGSGAGPNGRDAGFDPHGFAGPLSSDEPFPVFNPLDAPTDSRTGF